MEDGFNNSPLDDALPATPRGGLLSVAIGDIVQSGLLIASPTISFHGRVGTNNHLEAWYLS